MSGAGIEGRCLCGAVHLRLSAPLTEVHGCHCSQCRKQSGHFVAAGNIPREAVAIEGAAAMTWFEATPGIRRGFCATCGSHLLWDDGGAQLSVNLGSLEAPTGLKLAGHIFVADKGDYYEIADGLPQHAVWPED